MIKTYIKLAFRSLLKYKTQNIISVVGLAVSILCFSLCFYLSRMGMNMDRCFEHRDRIATVTFHNAVNGGFQTYSPAAMPAYVGKFDLEEIEAVTHVTHSMRKRDFIVEMESGEMLPYHLTQMETDTLFERIFTPEIIAGSWHSIAGKVNSVLMTESCAVRLFGNAESAVGKRIVTTDRNRYSQPGTPATGGITYTVEAVMEDYPMNNGMAFMKPMDIITVNDSDGIFNSKEYRGYWAIGTTYALLREGSDVGILNERLRANTQSDASDYIVQAALLTHKYSHSSEKSRSKILVLITASLGLLIILVGFINFFHFLIGSFRNRMKEFSIMKLYGSRRNNLFILLFIECLFMLFVASFLVLWMVEVFSGRLDFSFGDVFAQMQLTFNQDALYVQVLEYLGIAVLLCMMVCYVISRRIYRITVQNGIYGGSSRRGRQLGTNFMLWIQFLICWVFIIGTGYLFMQSRRTATALFDTLSHQEKEEVFSVSLEYSFMSQEDKMAMVDRIRQHSGVKDILLADIAYLDGTSGPLFYTDPDDEENSYIDGLESYLVPENFFSFMNLPIEQGREFRAPNEIIVDRSWAQLHGDELSENMYLDGEMYTVCGICPAIRHKVQRYTFIEGFAYVYHDMSEYVGHCYVKSHPGQAKEVKAWIEKVCGEMLPSSVKPEIPNMIEDINAHQGLEHQLMKLILLFSAVSIILTLLGVYSCITLDTERRRKEIAIRKVNGARMKRIILLFARRYIILLLTTAVIAFPLGYILTGILKESYTAAFNCGPVFWIVIFLAVALLTFLTIIFRIIGTARRNPAEELKNE